MYCTIPLSKFDNFDRKVHWNSSSKDSDADILHNLRRFMQKASIGRGTFSLSDTATDSAAAVLKIKTKSKNISRLY